MSVEADGHDVCTVTFADCNDREAGKVPCIEKEAGNIPHNTSSNKLDTDAQRRHLEFYMKDAERDGSVTKFQFYW